MEQEMAYLTVSPPLRPTVSKAISSSCAPPTAALVASYQPQTATQLTGVTWEVVNYNHNEQAVQGVLLVLRSPPSSARMGRCPARLAATTTPPATRSMATPSRFDSHFDHDVLRGS